MRHRRRDVRHPGYVAGMSDFTIKALTPETFDDFADLVERLKGGLFGGCWCVHFHPDSDLRDIRLNQGRQPQRSRSSLVRGGASRTRRWSSRMARPWPGPSTAHRTSCPTSSTASSTTPRRSATVRLADHLKPGLGKTHRRQGLAETALRGALDLIAATGGGLVEGYRHDMALKDFKKKVSASFIYNGTRRNVRAGRLHLHPAEGPVQLRDAARGGCEPSGLNRRPVVQRCHETDARGDDVTRLDG